MSKGDFFPSFTEAELYELTMPGRLIGKEVLDGSARRIGIVRSVRIRLPDLKVELVVKGLEIEFPVDVSNISAVGTVIQLKNVIKEAEEIEIHDVVRLRKEVWEEIKSYLGSR